ncbi:hypothetical protein [Bradyrhizobium sp. AZCC 2289]|uniref:hypothetical protein n=1 Tax=Bradyrhizobium sp. AZCC 2289 TaxID=3117026 RepID=UPI002FEFF80C
MIDQAHQDEPVQTGDSPESSMAESGTVRNFDADLVLDERDQIAESGGTSLTFPFNFSYGKQHEHRSC